jgi:hypothetical protein
LKHSIKENKKKRQEESKGCNLQITASLVQKIGHQQIRKVSNQKKTPCFWAIGGVALLPVQCLWDIVGFLCFFEQRGDSLLAPAI